MNEIENSKMTDSQKILEMLNIFEKSLVEENDRLKRLKEKIEEDIYRLIKEKEKLINKIMDKTIDFYKPESMETELINIYKNKYIKE